MKVGVYEVVREIARGGMGVVYLARDPNLGREVALKLLGLGSDAARERFAREAEALGRLRHPAIVPIHDAGQFEDQLYMVLEYVPGTSLEQRLTRSGPLTVEETIELFVPLADAVAHAHQAQILHRDLKPSNVLLDEQGRPKLTDFGLARLRVESSALSKTGQISGTPGFFAPEQARGDQAAIGPATDVYGLGATIYAVLTGVAPQKGATLAEVLVATLERPPEPPSSLRPDRDARLDEVCARCLAKDPAQRFASAAELGEALQLVARGQKRTSWRWLVAALCLGLLASGAGLWVQRRHHRLSEVERYLRLDGTLREPLERSVAGWSLGLGSGPPPALAEVVAAREFLAEHGGLALSVQDCQAALARLEATEIMLRRRDDLGVEPSLVRDDWLHAAASLIESERGAVQEAWTHLNSMRPDPLRPLVAAEVLGRELEGVLARSATYEKPFRLEEALAQPSSRARQLGLSPPPAWSKRSVEHLDLAAPAWKARLRVEVLRHSARSRKPLSLLDKIQRVVPEPGPALAKVLIEAREDLDRWALSTSHKANLLRSVEVANQIFELFPGTPEAASATEVLERLMDQEALVHDLAQARAMLRHGVLPHQGHELFELARAGGVQQLLKAEPRSRAARFWQVLQLHRLREKEDPAHLQRILQLCRQIHQGTFPDLHSGLVAFVCVWELNALERLGLEERAETLALTRRGLEAVGADRFPALYADLLRYELRALLQGGPDGLDQAASQLRRRSNRLLQLRAGDLSDAPVAALRTAWNTLLHGAFSSGGGEIGDRLAHEFLELLPPAPDEPHYLAILLQARWLRAREGKAAELAFLEPHLALGPRYSEHFAIKGMQLLCANHRQDEARDLLREALAAHPADVELLKGEGKRLGLLP